MTMQVTRWVLGLVAVALIAWGAYWALAVYGLYRAATNCRNEILNETVSSDGNLTATAFEQNCGATAPFLRIVSVRATNKAFDSEAEKQYVFVVEGQPDLQVAWDGPRHLSVKFGGGYRVVRQALIWYGVTVAYD